MKKFAVIGNPINHSLSPLMHESIFKQIGLKARYEKIQIKPFELEKFVRSNKLDGYNVTIPYKKIILKYLESIENSAKSITAVNCVSNQKGYNTDWIGFIKTLEDYEKVYSSDVTNLYLGFKNGKNIELRGFGTISRKINKEKYVRNPKTNEKLFKNKSYKLHFKLGKILHNKINNLTAPDRRNEF